MSKTSDFETDVQKNIDYAYKVKECMDYIECGSFEKDLDRVIRTLSDSNGKPFTNNKKENPKLGTLIGKSMFFTCLTDEKIIRQTELLHSKYNNKTSPTATDKAEIYHFDSFNVKVEGSKISMYISFR